MSKDALLKVRKAIKDKKPEFKQQNFGRKKRVSNRWRKPRGIQSKMRHQFKGYPRIVKQGWRSPVEVRGLDNKGFETKLVHNVHQLADVRKDQGIIIASTVGNKKRLEIITKAESQGIKVLNIKTDKFKEKIAKSKENRQLEKKSKEEKKKKTIEDSLKKAEKKEKEKTEKKELKTDDQLKEQKAEEKKEKDEVLIHKE